MSVNSVSNDSVTEMSEFAEFWLGATLGSGSYSRVVEAIEKSSGKVFAAKLARPLSCEERLAATGCFLSRPLTQMTGAFGNAMPLPGALLLKQYESWRNVRFEGWPSVHTIIETAGETAVIMDLVEGTSLRELIQKRTATIEHARLVIRTMVAMEAQDKRLRHGDMKPENILISGANELAYVLDPGYFGRVECYEQLFLPVAMTTPAYYPFLDPDDMFAIGVIILEVATGQNPLSLDDSECSSHYPIRLGEDLSAMLERETICGKYFPAALYSLPEHLSKQENLGTPGLRDCALKCMGLKLLADGTLTLAKPFESFAQLLKEI